MKQTKKATKRTSAKTKTIDYVLPPGRALVMRTCNADMTSAIGEDGIEPNTFYRCDDTGKLVKADAQDSK
jgi:hypothetical protein